ncbi:DUF3465 domain-containing protein [Thalassotalea litorea]|uniref:DUF3465 domain-containing protein n=1 Tax=Thalassotalea litorea TaxID=2020715 RepID=UPI003736F688
MPRKNNINVKNISAGIICVLIVVYIINRPTTDSPAVDANNSIAQHTSENQSAGAKPTNQANDKAGDIEVIEQAFKHKQSDLQVQAQGVVEKTLTDDNKGSRHQRFILRLTPSLTVLIAHNIDLAPKIENLRAGDKVEFYGEYEWNPKGGVIHWTHHDPNNKHVDGWLKHHGRIYQ